jgi:hypothetical protein
MPGEGRVNELQSQEQFKLLHESTVKDVQLELAQLRAATKKPTSPVVDDVIATLDQVLTLVAKENVDAERAFRGAIDAMGLVEARQFVLANLLEGLKRGEKAEALVTRFRQLGLRGPQPPATEEEYINSDANITEDVTKGMGVLKRTGLALAQLTVNALRTIPKFVEIEPSLSLIGPLPVLTFALKGKGMSIHELFEALRAPGRYQIP